MYEDIAHKLPTAIRDAKRWLLWKLEPNQDPTKKPRKIPYYANGNKRSGRLDTPEDIAAFATFDQAVAVLNNGGGYTGLGFALGPDGTGNFWQGIDLDSMEWVDHLKPTLPGYKEVSPSGKGCHAIGYGREFRSLGNNGRGLEAYAGRRYFTVTGIDAEGEPTDIADYVERTIAPNHKGFDANVQEIPPKTPQKTIPTFTPNFAYGPVPESTFADLRSALKAIPADIYEVWISMGMALKPLGDQGYFLWMEWSQRDPRFNREEAEKKWNSLHPDSTGYRAVFAEAQRRGWVNPAAKVDPPQPSPDQPQGPPRREALVPTEEEIQTARLAPTCFVENYLYADVAVLVAPGGAGKTTLLLRESIALALSEPIWGLRTFKGGWTLIVTAEDSRERLIARLRRMMHTMLLSEEQKALVYRSVLFWDVTGENRKLAFANQGNLELTTLADQIVETYRNDPPAVLIFDPLVSFGVSEQQVNDNEQVVITAARRIVRGLDCCVRLVHHTGQAKSGTHALDQYAARGGSALSDGSRMFSVMQRFNPNEPGDLNPPPECDTDDPDASITVLARPKVSYAPPNLPNIWIRRSGFSYSHFIGTPVSEEERRSEHEARLEQFLIGEYEEGRYWTSRQLEDNYSEFEMGRNELRSARTRLEVSGRIEERDLPKELRKGAKKTFLFPTHCATRNGAIETENEEFSFL